MKITIESTNQLVSMDGVPVRVWEGVTEDGIPCYVFVHRLCVREDQNTTQFENELIVQRPPKRF